MSEISSDSFNLLSNSQKQINSLLEGNKNYDSLFLLGGNKNEETIGTGTKIYIGLTTIVLIAGVIALGLYLRGYFWKCPEPIICPPPTVCAPCASCPQFDQKTCPACPTCPSPSQQIIPIYYPSSQTHITDRKDQQDISQTSSPKIISGVPTPRYLPQQIFKPQTTVKYPSGGQIIANIGGVPHRSYSGYSAPSKI